jgi:hypothetical protein
VFDSAGDFQKLFFLGISFLFLTLAHQNIQKHYKKNVISRQIYFKNAITV